MNILVTILTTNNLELLELCYKSVAEQKDTKLRYSVVIIVNTLDPAYASKVKEKAKEKFETVIDIVETQSNGKPGLGHNSALDYYRDQISGKGEEGYTHLVPLDGDDVLYPYAFSRLEKYLEYCPDVLMFGYTDILAYNYRRSMIHYVINGECYLYYNNFVKDMRKVWLNAKLSPFAHNINDTNTAGRLFLLSSEAAGSSWGLAYNEDLRWYDDTSVFLQIFEKSGERESNFRIFMLDDKDMYLYNKLNDDSVSINFNSGDVLKKRAEEEDIFRKSVENKYLGIREWDLGGIKFLGGVETKEFGVREKIEFCEDLVGRMNRRKADKIEGEMEIFMKYAQDNDIVEMKKIYEK